MSLVDSTRRKLMTPLLSRAMSSSQSTTPWFAASGSMTPSIASSAATLTQKTNVLKDYMLPNPLHCRDSQSLKTSVNKDVISELAYRIRINMCMCRNLNSIPLTYSSPNTKLLHTPWKTCSPFSSAPGHDPCRTLLWNQGDCHSAKNCTLNFRQHQPPTDDL